MKQPLWEILCVAGGGALGAVCRYLLTYWQGPPRLTLATWADWPWGTLVVNLLGCFFIGSFMAANAPDSIERWRLVFVVGFLGSFTTFSALGWESWQGFQQGQVTSSLFLLGLHIVLGLLMVQVGFLIGHNWSKWWLA